MLDGLRSSENAGIERRAVGEVFHDFLAFLDEAVDRLALHAAGRLAEHFEYFFQPFDLALVLRDGFRSACSSSDSAFFAIFGQRLQDLLLGVVDVLQRMKEEIVRVFLFGMPFNIPPNCGCADSTSRKRGSSAQPHLRGMIADAIAEGPRS